MGLERYLGRIADVMAPHLGDELAYHHTATGTDTTVVGFLKWKSDETDPIGRPTKRQRIPVMRVQNLPWSEDDVVGDWITGTDDVEWYVNGALTRASGWTDLYVDDRGPRR